MDQLLTQQFGEFLEGDRTLTAIEDPLLPVLLQFKDLQEKTTVISGKEEVWAFIDQNMSQPARILWIGRKFPLQRWAAAAIVLIASMIGLYQVFIHPASEIVLETHAQKGQITLQDGSVVTLRPYSKLMLSAADENKQTYSLQGEGYFEVRKNPGRSFSVITGESKVTVLGTRFNLSNWGRQVQVFLEEGRVQFEHTLNPESIELIPGQAALSNPQGEIQLIEKAEAEVFNDWRSDQLIFKQSALAEVVAELEHHFDIHILIPEDLNAEILNGGISLESPERSLEYLALALNGEFKKITDTEYQFISTID